MNNVLITDGGDDRDGVEEGSGECPCDVVLVLLAVPALLLQGDDQALLKATQLTRHLPRPVVLPQNLHLPTK